MSNTSGSKDWEKIIREADLSENLDMSKMNHDPKDLFDEHHLEETTQQVEENSVLGQQGKGIKDDSVAAQSEMLNFQDKIQELHQEIENIKKLHLADTANLKKRHQKEIEDAHKYSVEKLINSLFPVIDSIETSLGTLQKSGEEIPSAVIDGMELTLKLCLDTVARFGVEQINPLHQPFNPNHHEAMAMRPAEGVENNHVIEVLQKGYLLHGRVVRAALVVVAKNQ